MGSIVGESTKWRNATASDVAGLDVLISNKTSELNNAVTLYSQAMNGIQLCGNSALGCVSKSGRHISTWRDQRDLYGPIVDRLRKELIDLQDRRNVLVDAINKSANVGQVVATTSIATAEATKALAQADTVKTVSSLTKYGLIAGIGLVIIIGGIIAYKMIRKK